MIVTNVDAKLRFEMRLELPRLQSGQGTTVVYVTQDYKEAMALGNRIAVLSEGVVQQLGTPADIYLSPSSLSIARLFGDPVVNSFDVIPKRDDRGVYVELSGVPLRLSETQAASVDRPSVLAVRPESIRFCDASQADAIPIFIEAETPLNEKSVTLALTEGKREILISRPSGTIAPTEGQAFISIDAGRAMIFDRDSEQLIDQQFSATRGAGKAA